MIEAVSSNLTEKKKKEKSLIASYRCGNEMRGGQHWREENEKTCSDRRGSGEENIMHILKECEVTKDEMPIEEFLSEEG